MRITLPDYLCPHQTCIGDGWAVNDLTRTARPCRCRQDRIEERNALIRDRDRGTRAPVEESSW